MTEKDKREEDPHTDQKASQMQSQQDEKIYIYKDAELTERQGHIPAWLLLVVVVLVAWGIYYLIEYWHSPGVSN